MLPKLERLSLEKEIRRVIGARQYTGKRPLLYLVARDNSLKFSRLAVVVPKSFGGAVLRNRLRRRINAVFAKFRQKIFSPVDVVVYPKRPAVEASMNNIFADFMAILKDWSSVCVGD